MEEHQQLEEELRVYMDEWEKLHTQLSRLQ
jgi:hypothetical protein